MSIASPHSKKKMCHRTHGVRELSFLNYLCILHTVLALSCPVTRLVTVEAHLHASRCGVRTLCQRPGCSRSTHTAVGRTHSAPTGERSAKGPVHQQTAFGRSDRRHQGRPKSVRQAHPVVARSREDFVVFLRLEEHYHALSTVGFFSWWSHWCAKGSIGQYFLDL